MIFNRLVNARECLKGYFLKSVQIQKKKLCDVMHFLMQIFSRVLNFSKSIEETSIDLSRSPDYLICKIFFNNRTISKSKI